jgi:hypothetical protein
VDVNVCGSDLILLLTVIWFCYWGYFFLDCSLSELRRCITFLQSSCCFLYVIDGSGLGVNDKDLLYVMDLVE